MFDAQPPLLPTPQKTAGNSFQSKGETAVGRILLSRWNMGFSSRFFSLPMGIISVFDLYVKDIIDMRGIINWHDEETFKNPGIKEILGNLSGFLWKRRS